MKRAILALVVALSTLCIVKAAVARAQGSVSTLNFQGELADSSDNPLDGHYNMRFAIYDAPGGGNRVWPTAASYEQHSAVSVDNGLFNVLLGSGGHPLGTSDFDGGDRHLQVWVCQTAGAGCSSYQALSPRPPIASVVYALTAQTLLPGALIVNNHGRGLTVETGSGSDYVTAIYGHAASDGGETVGVWGATESDDDGAMGVLGQAGGPGQTYGVAGQTSSSHTDAAGVYGQAQASSGQTYGLYGTTASGTDKAAGVYGRALSTSGGVVGVYGRSDSSQGYGVYSEGNAHVEGSLSVEGAVSAQTVWADLLGGQLRYGANDPSIKDAIHVFSRDPVGHAAYLELRASDSYTPVVTLKNSGGGGGLDAWVAPNRVLCPDCFRPVTAAVRGFNFGSVGSAGYFEHFDGSGKNTGPALQVVMWNSGDALYVNTVGDGWAGYFGGVEKGVQIEVPQGKPGLEVVGGTKSAVVETSQGSRALYSEEATEVWFSDYGFGRLKDGQVAVHIDALFAETVNLEEPYHVFVQPYGDAELYVTERTAGSFQVRLRAGDPEVEFSYRIVAKRRGYEDTRLEPSEARHLMPEGMPGGD